MSNKKNPLKCRNMMYEQKLSYLPSGMTVDDVYDRIDTVLKPKRWAGLVHDSDVKKDGVTPADDHIHVMLQFVNERSIKQVAKELGEAPQQLQRWNDKVENGFSYLIHATANARAKHQYSTDQVKANFDYVSYINDISQKVSKIEGVTSSNKINAFLDMIAIGEMSLKEAKSQLSGSAYAKASAKLEKAHALHLERSAEKLHREMVEKNQTVGVHWLYGESETGKTRLSQIMASELGEYYKTTTQKDPLQFYEAQHIILLDEIRPDVISYSELLAMFDPFSRGQVVMSSRFYNKVLACHTFFVTSPYDPVTFYYATGASSIDCGEQLYRRLTSVLKMNLDYIYKMEYNPQSGVYEDIEKKENHYSKKNVSKNIIVPSNLFDSID